jgi:microcystin degradation protein MlrC
VSGVARPKPPTRAALAPERRQARIAIGGLWHETNTFAPDRTRLEDFERFQLKRGEAVIRDHSKTGTELGGVITAAAREPQPPLLLPLLFAAAVPSGTVEARAFEFLLDELIDEVRRQQPVDGVVLVLHGAMVADRHPDPEGELVHLVRSEIGQAPPLVVTLDLHANVGDSIANAADVLVGYHTYPHTDIAQRGEDALRLLLHAYRRQCPPAQSLVKLPLLTVPQTQETEEEPMRSIEALRTSLEARPGVWTASVFLGYPYSDTDRLGVAVYVAADSSEIANECANTLASAVWEQRNAFAPMLVEPDVAISAADALEGPVVLVDVADNVGGGSPGDGTLLVRLLEQRARRDAVVVLWDPAAVDALSSLIPGDDVEAEIGGRSLPELGPPALVRGRAFSLGAVRYRRRGPYMAGQEVDMGRVVRLETAAGDIVVTERRVAPFDEEHVRVAGVDPEKARIIVTKSAIAWKAAFGRFTRQAFYVRTPGLCPSDLRELAFQRAPNRLFPLSEGVQWKPL